MAVAKNIHKSKPLVKVSMGSNSEESSSSEASMQSDNEENEANYETKNTNKTQTSVDSDIDLDADAGSEDSDDDTDNNGGGLMTNEGWADSVAKILGSKKPKNKKTLVLSRAKKHQVIVKAEKEVKPAFEVIGDEVESQTDIVKRESKALEPQAKKVKNIKPSLRIKPNILEKDRERLLAKIATKGVVQLFNAVRNQQKTLQKEIDRNDLSESKKEKILKKFDKRAFLDTLMGQSKSVVVDEESSVTKNEVKDENTPKWGVLRDDFMMGAKMKDWDKESVDE